MAGGGVESECGVGLGAHDAVGALWSERVDDTVVDDARGVHDRGEGAAAGQVVDEPSYRVGVGDIAGDHRHGGPQFGQFRDEFVGAGGSRAAP